MFKDIIWPNTFPFGLRLCVVSKHNDFNKRVMQYQDFNKAFIKEV